MPIPNPNRFRPWTLRPYDPALSDTTNQLLDWAVTHLNQLQGSLTPLSSPDGILTTSFPFAVQIKWNEVPGAGVYQIFEATQNSFNQASLVGSVPAKNGSSTNSFLRSGLQDSTKRFYFIQPLSLLGFPGTPSAGVGGNATANAVNLNTSFLNDAAISLVAGSVTEIGTVTLTESGGTTEIWGSCVMNPTVGVCDSELHDGTCAGTQLAFAGNFSTITPVTFHTIVTAGTGSRTFKLCGGLSGGGTATATYRKLLAANRRI